MKINKCSECGCFDVEHSLAGDCPIVDGATLPEPKLNLLVVDFGNRCAVRVEKGSIPASVIRYDDADWTINEEEMQATFYMFGELRAAIDAHFAENKPVPRIERDEIGRHNLWYYDGIKAFRCNLGVLEMAAVNELARSVGATVDLPIYKPKGKWTQLASAPLSIWRYEM